MKAIAATGAVSGDDLLRSIPQMGDVSFNQANTPATSNAARGDVNSINLRSLGVGNTLVLLNGRRLVQHPTSQAGETGVPVLGYNSNSIPVAGVSRLEILRDGAAAIYGADAVAGVVNTVLQDNFRGFSVDAQYGGAEGTHLREFEANAIAGKSFSENRGNVTLFANYTHRTAQRSGDEDYTSSANLMPLFANDPAYAGVLTPDRRTIQTPWANLSTPAANGVIRQGTVALTSAAGAFHIQPSNVAGCASATAVTSSTSCIGVGTNAFTGVLRDSRYDVLNNTTLSPSLSRVNLFMQGHYEIADGITAFGEAGYYMGKTHQVQAPVLNLSAITIPASNYWNPFGPVTFANGTANPNRLPGLTNVPVGGLPVTLTNYRFVDAGQQEIDVKNQQYRALLGLRGNLGGFNWETAALYSWATARDSSDAIDSTKLQSLLALSTPDAYNPFNGGCQGTPAVGDCTPSSAIQQAKFKLVRRDKTTLALGDIKVSRKDLFVLPGGDVGFALGAEARRETQFDDRDPNIDTTITFRDSVTNAVNLSNATAVSPNPDTIGHRTVYSAYTEFAVPVISADMEIPLVRRVDLQIAGRYEHYSDFGSIAKPKIAGLWDVVDGVRLRGSYSKGFRAPNLEQVNATQYARAGSNIDYLRCEADLRAGRISSFSACGRTQSFSVQTSGNPNLKPEKSDNFSAGIVLQPKIADNRYGRFTFSADWWRIKETGVVGQIGAQNALVIDYLLRLQGSSNPNVVRATPTADDTTLFAGTGVAAAGTVLTIADQFRNLLPQDVRGVDFNFNWNLSHTPMGDFVLNFDAAYLYKYQRDLSSDVAALFAARAGGATTGATPAGTINAATPLTDASDVLRQNGKPKWKASGSFTWTYGPAQIGLFTQYLSSVVDPGFLDATGTPYVVDARLTANLYVQYSVPGGGALGGTRFRIGARNITNKQPPLSSGGANSGAYLGTLYNPYGRYWYMSVGRKF